MDTSVQENTQSENIQVISTSLATANVTPVILNSSDLFRLQFVPVLVDNPNSAEKCLAGKLVYEKKRKHEGDYPTDRLLRGDIRTGEYMEIRLDTTETLLLFNGLQEYYALHKEMGQIPLGESTFTRIDRNIKSVVEIIKADPSMMRQIANQDTLNLVKILLRVIMTSESMDNLLDVLSALESEGVERLSHVVSIEKLNRISRILSDNMDNSDEDFWQDTLTENHWILSQLFGTPMTIFQDKAYVGGKTINNTGGHICDFLYMNDISRNVALVEIKTPCTPIIGREYRNGIYAISNDLSGAISQVLSYKDSLSKEYNVLCQDSEYKVLNPICVVLTGKLNLSTKEMASFELFRNNLNGVTVVTYDELLERVNKLISIFSETKEDDHHLSELLSDFDDDNLPF